MIKADTELLAQQESALRSLAEQLESVSSGMKRVNSLLKWNITASEQVRRSISVSAANASALSGKMGALAGALQSAASLYAAAEMKNAGIENVGVINTGAVSAPIAQEKPESSWFEKLKDTVSGAFDFVVTGAEKVVNGVKDCVSYYVDNYNQKGWVYKTIETVKVGAKMVGSVAGTVAAWGAAVGTGGGAAVLAGISTAYTANTLANGFTDLHNLWGGDISQVGAVNYLKTGLTELGGSAGKLLGSEEIGQKVGKSLYSVGLITAAVTKISTLADKVIQSPDIVKSVGGGLKELKTGAVGAWDLVAHTDISNVAYEAKLLSYEVPHILETYTYAGLLKDIASKSADTVKNVYDFFQAYTSPVY